VHLVGFIIKKNYFLIYLTTLYNLHSLYGFE